MTAPSAWTVQSVMSIATSLAARLEADGVALDEAELVEYLRAENADVGGLLLRLARTAQEAKADAEAIATRQAALATRKARAGRVEQECRATLHAIMEAMAMRKYRHPELSVTISDGRPGVVVTDETALPDEYVRITRSPDKTAIKAALEQGVIVPGAELQNSIPQMTVRTK